MAPTPTTDQWGIDATWLDALDEERSVAQAPIDRLREVISTPRPISRTGPRSSRARRLAGG